MGVRKLVFPIALAILWVVMTALAMVDFATFNASMQQPVVAAVGEARPAHAARGRAPHLATR